MSVMVSNRTAGCSCCRTYGDNTKTRRLVKTQERHATTREIAEGIDEFFYAEPVSDEPVIAFEPTDEYDICPGVKVCDCHEVCNFCDNEALIYDQGFRCPTHFLIVVA